MCYGKEWGIFKKITTQRFILTARKIKLTLLNSYENMYAITKLVKVTWDK